MKATRTTYAVADINHLSQTTIDQLTAAIAEQCNARLQSEQDLYQAANIAHDILETVIPDGTLGWWAYPRKGEFARDYALRAYETAASRASWAGGLKDGGQACDSAVRESVAKLIRS